MKQKNKRVHMYICILIGVLISLFYGCNRPEPVCNDKYTEIKGSRLYFTENVSQEDIDALLDYLDFEDKQLANRYVKLDKSDSNHYYVYFYVSKYVLETEVQLKYYEMKAEGISIFAFNHNDVTVYLCNNKFEPQKTFGPEPLNTNAPDTSDDTVN